MRFLIISDTHGNLSLINQLHKKYDVDAVIHCGDFGFMSHKNMDHFTDRELSLNIKHWDEIPFEIRKKAFDIPREEKKRIIIEYQALGEFDKYEEGKISFDVPVYAVWGNHEDRFIVDSILTGEVKIPNLTLLTADKIINLFDTIYLTGIGGNFAMHRFFTQKDTHEFSPFMKFYDWTQLYLNRKKIPKDKKRAKSNFTKGTWFFNLPDIYTGGYVIIEEDRKKIKDKISYKVKAYGNL